MTTEINAVFKQVRDRLQQLGNGVADLAQNHADILDSPTIKDSLVKFRQAYEESMARLAKPNFTIATIGTTSSGKSTIVNALIGRKIAPIEAGEMSGGILTIQHSKEFKLFIEETEGAQWLTGEWEGISEKEIYARIRNGVMFPYHQARQKQELIAPQVRAYVPILPAEDASLLGLPEGIGIEFIDLPGLKSIQDRDNLKVIQQQVHKAFSLVALDYLQVDDRHRQRLLEELKKVVEYLQGRTDSMIFILNRIDQRGQDDITLAERIEQLQLEIQETLKIERLPDIIPLSGRFLYYAQCAWGTNAINSNSLVDATTRRQYLSGMLKDCSSLIRSHVFEDKTLKKWFRDIEDRLDDGDTIDDESMRKILDHVNSWSGGDRLWQCMRDRVRESFAELVILPALIDVLENYKHLVNVIDVEVNIKKIGKKEEIENKQQNIIDGSERLIREVENIRGRFRAEIEEIIGLLKGSDSQDKFKTTQYLDSKSHQGFSSLLELISQIEGDLIQRLIFPVRDALEQDKGTYELEEELTEVVTPPNARAIAKAYDLVNRKLAKFKQDDSGYFIRQVRHDDQGKIRSMDHSEKAVRSLYYAMRKAITKRAEFTLQGHTKQFETGLLSLVNRLIEEIKNACLQELPDLDLDKVIISDFEHQVMQNPPQLPEELFSFADTIQQNTTSQREVVGKKKETEHYTEGSCFKQEKTRTVTKNIYDDIEYRELKLPNYKNMARQWAEGITQEKQKLWNIFDDWISNYLNLITKECDRSINKAIKSTERAFDKQLQEIEKNAVKQEEYWQQFERELNAVSEIYQQLK
ncbi:hypothetical protein NIES4102_25980 [Chondrocystis sp. NIES-4102]|nr:hypothetical protein NIES4102_25980 [Chondrocystis sp. NIES-4102]